MFILHFTIIFSITITLFISSVELIECPFNNTLYTGKKEKYIIIFKKSNYSSTTSNVEKHFTTMENCLNRQVERVFQKNGNYSKSKDILEDFSVKSVLEGYSGWFDPLFVKEQLSKMDEIKIIEKVIQIKINYEEEFTKEAIDNRPSDNLDRIDQAKLPLDGKYIYPDSAGEGVNIYILDTGIRRTHSQFEGRALFGDSFCAKCGDFDRFGHGTFVASVAAGKKYGVARKATLISVTVSNRLDLGTDDVTSGMMYVVDQHINNQNKNSVINISLGVSQKIQAWDDAAQALIDAGVHVVIASGNDHMNTPSYPGSPYAPGVIMVSAIDNFQDYFRSSANSGPWVDIFAPGEDIIGANYIDDAINTLKSGTSFAAPHVAGTIALIISKDGNKSPKDMKNTLIDLSTKDVIKDLPSEFPPPNRLLRVPTP